MHLYTQCTYMNHTFTYTYTPTQTHMQNSSPFQFISGTVTVFPFKICFMDYGYPMMEYKILYLKGVNESPNVCLCLGSRQFSLLESCLQLWDIDLIHSERPQ